MVFELQLYVLERLVVTVGLNNMNLLMDDGAFVGIDIVISKYAVLNAL